MCKTKADVLKGPSLDAWFRWYMNIKPLRAPKISCESRVQLMRNLAMGEHVKHLVSFTTHCLIAEMWCEIWWQSTFLLLIITFVGLHSPHARHGPLTVTGRRHSYIWSITTWLLYLLGWCGGQTDIADTSFDIFVAGIGNTPTLKPRFCRPMLWL